MNTKQLRQKILDLAIRGKLVPQDPNDEPASVLLEKIRIEKERLIKEKKIKQSKNEWPVSTINKSHYQNLSFDVPENWEWIRLGDICYDFQYGTSNKSEKKGKVAVLRMGNIQYGEIDYTDLAYTSNDLDIAKYLLNKEDLLFNRTNSPEWVGKTAIYQGKIPAIFAGYIIRVIPILVKPDFINYLMNSEYHRLLCNYSKTDGVNQSNINAQKLSNFLFPIAPLSEQGRIISAIESAFILIDEIENNKLFLKQLVKQAKSKILDLAIRGMLVSQNPNDEPASELLKRIKDKQKPKKTTSDTFPYLFDLPNGWTWCKFSELYILLSGRDLESGQYNDKEEGIPYLIGASNITNEKIEINRWTNVPKVISIKNDLLITCKGTVGELVINEMEEVHIARQFMAVRTIADVDIQFTRHCFHFFISSIKDSAKGIIPGISRNDILDLLIPLPPLSEQHRIVIQIEKIFAHLNKIDEALKA